MTRRRFMFWLSFGLFTLAERLGADSIDGLAAAAMESAKPRSRRKAAALPVHWTVGEDDNWRWYEREHYLDGHWWLTGTTSPIHKRTGERKQGNSSYLDDRLVPANMRADNVVGTPRPVDAAEGEIGYQLPNAARRRRHGRPPSKWLRSLHADEIRIWLKTIECPEAGVSGMTYWTHLTRDHSFDPEKIVGLTEAEQAKLHGAAHFGY